MKNLLMYMYNLKEIKTYKSKDSIKIKSNDKEYILYKINNPKRVLEIDKILNNKTEYYKIVRTINNEILIQYNNEIYVLLELNNNYEILSNYIVLNDNEYKTYEINQSNWIKLWTIKNDYYESLTINNIFIQETINYYIGIAENAIEFLKFNDINTNRLFVCNTSEKDKYNPLNIVLDCKEREVSEKIKYKFFYEEITIEEIKEIIKFYDLKKIIGRLLYPNYYFDIVDEFINNKINEDKLRIVLSKQTKYECFIKEIAKNTNIEIPEWIKKDK